MIIKLMLLKNGTNFFRYLGDLLNIGNPYFAGMVNQTYHPEPQLNKANASYTEAHFYIIIYF